MLHNTALSLPQLFLCHLCVSLSLPVKGLLGIQDLGQAFFEPVKDKQGNILIVTLKEVKTNQTFESVRWVPVSKLQGSRKSVSSPEEPTALDILLITVQVANSYQRKAGWVGEGSWASLEQNKAWGSVWVVPLMGSYGCSPQCGIYFSKYLSRPF